MSKILCVYHANCADGFAAATVVRLFFGADNVDFHPAQYGDPIPDVSARDVVIVDFSYPIQQLEALAERNDVLVLDHHKTAAKDLESVPPVRSWQEFERLQVGAQKFELRAVFDMERSGAGLVWDFFNSGKPRPKLVDYVEDRDLWRFKFENSRPVHAYLSSYPFDFGVWTDRMTRGFEHETATHMMVAEGLAIERAQLKAIENHLKSTMDIIRLGKSIVPCANVPFSWASEAGNIMCKGHAFAVTYCDTADHRVFSLRSSNEGEDVSLVAKNYGGGGHRNAAGFKAEKGWFGDGV